jgi:hypothetical protein
MCLSDKGKVRLTLTVKPQIDMLLRNHCRRKGDLSRVISELIMAKWGSELVEMPAQP